MNTTHRYVATETQKSIIRQTPIDSLLRLLEKNPELYEVIQDEIQQRAELKAAHVISGTNHR